MQIVYNKNNIKLNYINNYTKFIIDGDCVRFYNTLYGNQITLKGSHEVIEQLLRALHKGISDNQLIKILSKISNNPNSLYEYLLQNFVVE